MTSQKIVKPEDISVINPTMDSQLTLITCYPTYYIGPAPKRLVVFSKLVESDGQPVAQAAPAVKRTAAVNNLSPYYNGIVKSWDVIIGSAQELSACRLLWNCMREERRYWFLMMAAASPDVKHRPQP